VNQHERPPPRLWNVAFEKILDRMRYRLPSFQQKLRAEPPVFGRRKAVILHQAIELPHQERIPAESPPQAVEKGQRGLDLRAAIRVRPGICPPGAYNLRRIEDQRMPALGQQREAARQISVRLRTTAWGYQDNAVPFVKPSKQALP